MMIVLEWCPDGPGHGENQREEPATRRQGGGVGRQRGDARDHPDREHAGGAEILAEDRHPGGDDQETSGRDDLEEVAIDHLAAKEPDRAMEENAFVAERSEVSRNRAAHDQGERRGGIEAWVSEEARFAGVRDERL